MQWKEEEQKSGENTCMYMKGRQEALMKVKVKVENVNDLLLLGSTVQSNKVVKDMRTQVHAERSVWK